MCEAGSVGFEEVVGFGKRLILGLLEPELNDGFCEVEALTITEAVLGEISEVKMGEVEVGASSKSGTLGETCVLLSATFGRFELSFCFSARA